MKRKHIYLLITIIIAGIFYLSEEGWFDDNDQIESTTSSVTLQHSKEFDATFLPASTTGAVVEHNYYTLSYSEEHEQSEWVAYELKKSDLSNNNFDRLYFNEDTKVSTGSAD